MFAGKLDKRVGLQAPVETNTDGSLVITYPATTTVWAQVENVTGRRGFEALEAGKPNARSFIGVTMRYRDDVNDSWRLVWKGQNYRVRTTDRSKQRKGLLYVIAEVVGAL